MFEVGSESSFSKLKEILDGMDYTKVLEEKKNTFIIQVKDEKITAEYLNQYFYDKGIVLTHLVANEKIA